MGQCGCSDTAPDYVLPGPDGITYAIQIYPSCQYCGSPVGVDVFRFDQEDAELWASGVGELEFMPYVKGGVSGQAAIPVLEPAALVKALGEWNEDVDDYQPVSEGELRHSLPQAVWQTLSDWHDALRAPAESPKEVT